MKKQQMKNSDYIKQNYKTSTIVRLRDLGYDTEHSLDIDPDVTYALGKCKEMGKENQDTLFGMLHDIHQEFYDFMDTQYPNGIFG
jgi:hypothetical protein